MRQLEETLEKIENGSAVVGVVGLGYVGLPLVLGFAERGFQVIGLDIDTLHKIEGVDSLQLNEIGRIRLRTAVPLLHDEYRRNRHTGSFILIDPGSNETVGAGMIL